MQGVDSESDGEGEVECEGSASAIDRGALRVRAPIKNDGILCLSALTEPCS